MITFLTATALVAVLPSTQSTNPAAASFGVMPVSDLVLAQTRGTAPSPHVMTRGQLRSVTSAQARDGFQFNGAIPRTQMDVWWGTIGSQLIANSVRGQLQ